MNIKDIDNNFFKPPTAWINMLIVDFVDNRCFIEEDG